MSDFDESIRIETGADEVFAFVSNVQNLPLYLPTVRRAAPQLGQRAEIEGTVDGRRYLSDVDLRVDHATRSMHWGSDGEYQYRGWLTVGGRNGTCEVKVHLSFTSRPDLSTRNEGQSGNRDRTIREGVRKALRSIKTIVEEKAGTREILRAA